MTIAFQSVIHISKTGFEVQYDNVI